MPRYVGHYELGHLLGSGGFGKVYYGRDSKTSAPVAVKIIDKALIKANQMEEYVDREIAIMKRLEHPHVIRLKAVVELPSSFCLIMELANNGELFDRIIEARRFDEPMARCYFQQLVSAVAYCHQKGVVHRDLKAENLLLGENDSLKVCDFGLSRYTLRNGTVDHNLLFMSVAGSPDYQAPEVSTSDAGYHGEACDVWSCGVILFFMLAGTLPFAGRDDEETATKVATGNFDRSNKHLTPLAADLIGKILQVNPDKRITVWDIVEHEWFAMDLDRAKLFPDAPRCERPQASPLHPGAGFVVAGKEQYCGDSIVMKLHRAFQSCNVDHSGHLKKSEIRDVLISLNNGSPVSDEEVLGVMECFKMDDDFTISEEEFVQGWSNAEKRLGNRLPLDRLVNIFHYDLEKTLVEDLRKAFDRLDLSNDGLLTAENVQRIQELNLTEEEAKQLILAMDSRKSGRVTFEDFVSAVTSADLLRNAFGAKLHRIRELFNAVDRAAFSSYINTGFTVAGFRDSILQKLISDGAAQPTSTTFEAGEAGFLHGAHQDSQMRNLQIGVQLLPATPGYTRVLAYRIAGKTEVFHNWFRLFRGLLHEEIVRFHEDTSVKGATEVL